MQNTNNLIFTLDAYKWGHEKFYPNNTQQVYSYLESRGGEYSFSIFFGLQYILKRWLTTPVSKENLEEAKEISSIVFFDDPNVFNWKSWESLINKHGGYLPLKIKAVPEGTLVGTNNVLMTIENTDPEFFWLTNAMETLLQQVWYPTTVCTRSFQIVSFLREFFKETSDNEEMYKFYLHDFAQRGVTCMEQAGVGGMAHLVNALGSDTMMAIPYACKYYNADPKSLLFSVKATEHSIQTSYGEQREFELTKEICEKCPDGILSVVSDSYNIERAVRTYCTDLKNVILARNGKFVVRPDSPRFDGDTPENQILWIVQRLWKGFGGTVNSKGYKVLDSHVSCIYGDSLTEEDIIRSLKILKSNGFSAENCVYGCGGYLLQKLNRDTQKFAIKCSSQTRNGEEVNIYKNTHSKSSRKGKLKLVKVSPFDSSCNRPHKTVSLYENLQDEMVTVFENGELKQNYNFSEIRERVENFM